MTTSLLQTESLNLISYMTACSTHLLLDIRIYKTYPFKQMVGGKTKIHLQHLLSLDTVLEIIFLFSASASPSARFIYQDTYTYRRFSLKHYVKWSAKTFLSEEDTHVPHTWITTVCVFPYSDSDLFPT